MVAIALTITALGCADRSPDSSSHADSGERSAPKPETRRDSSVAIAPPSDTCARFEGTEAALRGVVTQQLRSGPPGYGETPKLDKRDTILVLRLDTAINVCAGAFGTDARTTNGVREIQLTGHVDDIRSRLNTTVTVRGELLRAELAWHYTPIVFHVEEVVGAVDRIPSISVAPQKGNQQA
jgi:hypothetical protein